MHAFVPDSRHRGTWQTVTSVYLKEHQYVGYRASVSLISRQESFSVKTLQMHNGTSQRKHNKVLICNLDSNYLFIQTRYRSRL